MKNLLLRVSYALGLLGLFHRLRNRDALTVISLHRVIAEDDPRWATCDPLYTLSDRLFEQCVKFFCKHYSIITIGELQAARESGSRLPPRPLILTFDDGWADNCHFALPVLQRTGAASVLFVASDAIDRSEAFFQEQIIAAWRMGLLARSEIEAAWMQAADAGPPAVDLLCESAVRELIAALQSLPVNKRKPLLERLLPQPPDNDRQMLTGDELRTMQRAGVEIGTHGKRHEPLTEVEDVDMELKESRSRIAAVLGCPESEVRSMSFPFSRQDVRVIDRAFTCGYELLFGGGKSLTPLKDSIPNLIARVGVTASEIAGPDGRLLAYRLANELFRQRHHALDAGRP